MGRSPCCSKEGLNRGAWTSFEDQILTAYITSHGEGNWRSLPNRAGLKRCGKSCRLRWLNYLRPDIKRGNISRDEEDLITRLHKLLGNRWSLIAGRLPGRTDNEIKNYWNTTLGKKAKAQSSSTSKLSSPRVKARAARCAKVVVKATEATHLPDNHDVQSLTSTEIDPLEDPQENRDSVLKMDHMGHHEHEGFHHMSSDLGFLDFGQQMEARDQVMFMDKPFSEDWAANSCLGDHDSASLDLESLAFLLNSSEWP